MTKYYVHNVEKLGPYIQTAIREVAGEKQEEKYRYDNGLVFTNDSFRAKAMVRKIIEKAEEKYLEEHGRLYRVEFSGSYDVYAESEEQAEYIARGKLDMCCLNAYTEELCN